MRCSAEQRLSVLSSVSDASSSLDRGRCHSSCWRQIWQPAAHLGITSTHAAAENDPLGKDSAEACRPTECHKAPAYRYLGATCLRQGRRRWSSRTALAARPGDSPSRQYLAQAYSALDRHDEAIRHLPTDLRTVPDDFDLTIMLGRALHDLGDREGAVTTFSHAPNHYKPP